MFEPMEARIARKRMEPQPWHVWVAAAMALLVLANLALFALDFRGAGSIALAATEAAAVLIAGGFWLAGRLRAWSWFVVSLVCLAVLYWVR